MLPNSLKKNLPLIGVAMGQALPSAKAPEGASATRDKLVAWQVKHAARDGRFRELIANADAARDAGNWANAESAYLHALRLYPYHPGYRIQCAHMLKEQGKFVAAELHYRSAVAVGAPRQDVEQHLAFAAERNGLQGGSPPTPDLAASAMAAPPTVFDIETLGFVMFHGPISTEFALQIIRRCRTNTDVAVAMIADERFLQKNLPFLELLRG